MPQDINWDAEFGPRPESPAGDGEYNNTFDWERVGSEIAGQIVAGRAIKTKYSGENKVPVFTLLTEGGETWDVICSKTDLREKANFQRPHVGDFLRIKRLEDVKTNNGNWVQKFDFMLTPAGALAPTTTAAPAPAFAAAAAAPAVGGVFNGLD